MDFIIQNGLGIYLFLTLGYIVWAQVKKRKNEIHRLQLAVHNKEVTQ